MPPHVTLLVPAPADVEDIAEVLFAFASFEVVFSRLERFPGTLWLAPEPAQPFARMIDALVERFPGYPPYGGAVFGHGPPLPPSLGRPPECCPTLQPLGPP